MKEADFLSALRALPLHVGARGLADDTATLGELVLTKDLIAEGVHFLSADPPGDVAWKLVAVNLSDLAAKGATPEGLLLGYPLGDDAWDRAFLTGLDAVLRHFDCPLLGGDTITLPPGTPRMLSLTALGRSGAVPVRGGARAGDALYVTGTIGDAGAGLVLAQTGGQGPLVDRYRRPTPRLAEGRALAPLVHAMMDVSDGLLIDAQRMAAASGLAVTIDLDLVSLSVAYRAWPGADPLHAATAGDDYELLFAGPADLPLPVDATRIGRFAEGRGLTLTQDGQTLPLPDRLGFEHAAPGAP
jgi:thiamine-monophosphate kinase